MCAQLKGGHAAKGAIGPVGFLTGLGAEIILLFGHANIMHDITLENLLPTQDWTEISERYNDKTNNHAQVRQKSF